MLFAFFAAGGCGSHETGSTVDGGGAAARRGGTSHAAAAVIQAYVRVDALERNHPLYADVARLRRAEDGLRRAAGAGVRRPVGAAAALVLPPLPVDTRTVSPEAVTGAATARETRRQEARTRLQEDFASQMTAFSAERDRRQQRLEDQRRDELTALDALKEAERERLARDAANEATRQEFAATTGGVTQVEAGVNTADGQVDPGALAIALRNAPRDKTTDKIVDYDLYMQSLIEQRRNELAKELAAIRAQLNRISETGSNKANAAAKAVAQQREQEIEAELEPLLEDSETRFVVRAEQSALDSTLGVDQSLAERAEAERRALLLGEAGTASGSLALGEMFPAGPGAVDPAGALAAAERVRVIRERLERFIRADVVDTVKDIAQRRGLDVKLVAVPEPGSRVVPPLAAAQTAGRRDMTRQFLGWMQPGAAAILPTPQPPRTTAPGSARL